MTTNAWMLVRCWVCTAALVLAITAQAAVAQDSSLYAQEDDPEGVVLPGEEGSDGDSQRGDEDSANREEERASGRQERATSDTGSGDRVASRSPSDGDDLPQTGALAVPMALLGVTLIASGAKLRRRTRPRRRRITW